MYKFNILIYECNKKIILLTFSHYIDFDIKIVLIFHDGPKDSINIYELVYISWYIFLLFVNKCFL